MNQPKKDSKRECRRSHSSSSYHKDTHGIDIAKILKQQAEILQIIRPTKTVAVPTQKDSVPVTSAASGFTQAINSNNQAQAVQASTDDVIDDQAGNVDSNQAPTGAQQQDPWFVGVLNLAFAVDPNAGEEIDADIA